MFILDTAAGVMYGVSMQATTTEGQQMFDESTVRRLSDAELFNDQEAIQDDLEVATDPEHELYDPKFAETLRDALKLCNAELRRRGLLIYSDELVKP